MRAHGIARGQLDHAARPEGVAPLRVIADFGAGRIQYQAGLGVVGLRIGLDLLARERRAGGIAPARVPDHGREIADQEDDGMAELLQLAHLVQHHRMAEVDVGCRRIQAQLDAQRNTRCAAARQLLRELCFHQQFITATLDDGEIPLDLGCNRICLPRLRRTGERYGRVARFRFSHGGNCSEKYVDCK